MLDVANQVDWVRAVTSDLPDYTFSTCAAEVRLRSLPSVLPASERTRGAHGSGDLERPRQDPGGEESHRHPEQLPGVEDQGAAAAATPRQRPAGHVSSAPPK